MIILKSTPNSTNIEMSAVNKIEDALLRIGKVEPDIRGNDKTPSWDGELRVYKGKEFNKAQMYGRIPIQVKGKWVPRFQKSPINFDVEISDLKNYQKDGGVIYFVVHLKDYDNYFIYYKLLLPFDLRRLLSDSNSQKTKRIRLEKFPNRHIDGMMRILMEFILNKQKQGTLLPNVSSLGDLHNAGIEIEKFEISIPQIGIESNKDAFSYLLKEEPYIYAKPKGIEASFVVDKIIPESIAENRNNPVVVNGEILYDGVSIVRKSGMEPQIKIGKGISVRFDTNSLNIDYKYTGTLKEQIIQMKFLCALSKRQEISIGTLYLPCAEMQVDPGTSNEYADRLIWLQKIAQTFERLNVSKDLDLDILTSSDIEKLNMLVAAIIEGQPVPLGMNGKPGIGALTLGNIKVMLFCIQSDSEKLFYVSNLFESRDMALSRKDNQKLEEIPISPYIMLTEEKLKIADNIDFKQILVSVQSFPYTDPTGTKIVLFILELLKYFDSQETPDYNILNVVEELIHYLRQNNKENEDLYKVNLLQTIKRRRILTTDEKKYLIKLKQGASLEFQLAANILLESFQEAEVIFDQLNKHQKKGFKSYPIFNLWRRNT